MKWWSIKLCPGSPSPQKIVWRETGGSAIMVRMQVLYTIIYVLILGLLAPAIGFVLWSRKGYRPGFGQRLGYYPAAVQQRLANRTGPCCWIHAASIGEVHVALHFLEALRGHRPDLKFVLTTTALEGRTLAEQRRPAEVEILYFPFDLPSAVRRAFRLIRPDFIILVELEVWPNHLWTAAAQRVPVCLINARMPPADARRYRLARWFFRRLFNQPMVICAQGTQDAAQFRELGVPADRLQITGNLKADVALSNQHRASPMRLDAAQLFRQIGVVTARPIFVAGSTHPGEEKLLFDLLATFAPAAARPFLVVAPRDVDRASHIATLAQRNKLTTLRRSAITPTFVPPEHPVDCLVVDTLGELPNFYAAATLTFVGKSLIGHGGQNIVEAAAAGAPVVFGPHMENFQAMAQQFLAAGGAVQVADAGALRSAVQRLLSNAEERARICAAAQRVLQASGGATERTVALITAALPAVFAVARPPLSAPPAR